MKDGRIANSEIREEVGIGQINKKRSTDVFGTFGLRKEGIFE